MSQASHPLNVGASDDEDGTGVNANEDVDDDVQVLLGTRRRHASDDEDSDVPANDQDQVDIEDGEAVEEENGDGVEGIVDNEAGKGAATVTGQPIDNEDADAEDQEGAAAPSEDAQDPRGKKSRRALEPFEVPTVGQFYMHDDRFDEEMEASAASKREGRGKRQGPDTDRWVHDRFQELELDGSPPRSERGTGRGVRGRGRGRGRGMPRPDMDERQPAAESQQPEFHAPPKRSMQAPAAAAGPGAPPYTERVPRAGREARDPSSRPPRVVATRQDTTPVLNSSPTNGQANGTGESDRPPGFSSPGGRGGRGRGRGAERAPRQLGEVPNRQRPDGDHASHGNGYAGGAQDFKQQHPVAAASAQAALTGHSGEGHGVDGRGAGGRGRGQPAANGGRLSGHQGAQLGADEYRQQPGAGGKQGQHGRYEERGERGERGDRRSQAPRLSASAPEYQPGSSKSGKPRMNPDAPKYEPKTSLNAAAPDFQPKTTGTVPDFHPKAMPAAAAPAAPTPAAQTAMPDPEQPPGYGNYVAAPAAAPAPDAAQSQQQYAQQYQQYMAQYGYAPPQASGAVQAGASPQQYAYPQAAGAGAATSASQQPAGQPQYNYPAGTYADPAAWMAAAMQMVSAAVQNYGMVQPAAPGTVQSPPAAAAAVAGAPPAYAYPAAGAQYAQAPAGYSSSQGMAYAAQPYQQQQAPPQQQQQQQQAAPIQTQLAPAPPPPPAADRGAPQAQYSSSEAYGGYSSPSSAAAASAPPSGGRGRGGRRYSTIRESLTTHH